MVLMLCNSAAHSPFQRLQCIEGASAKDEGATPGEGIRAAGNVGRSVSWMDLRRAARGLFRAQRPDPPAPRRRRMRECAPAPKRKQEGRG